MNKFYIFFIKTAPEIIKEPFKIAEDNILFFIIILLFLYLIFLRK